MKDIAIYGAGGLGREVASLFSHISSWRNKWNFIGFFDDNPSVGLTNNYGEYLGGIYELNARDSELDIVLCFGNPNVIKTVFSKINNPKISFPNIITPDVWVSDKTNFEIGMGNIIVGHSEFTTNIHVGNFNLFNGSVVIGHDTHIGDYNVFMPACRISGDVKIGNGCVLGTLSFVHQGLKIPDNVVLSPLSAMLSNPKSGKTYIGNPAKLFRY